MGSGGSKSSSSGDADFFDDLEMINSTLGPPSDYPAFVDGGGDEDVMVMGGGLGLNDTEGYGGNYTSPVGPQGYSTLHIVIASIILTCMMIVVVIGNMLVIIAIATEKSLKNLQNWFIASLAVADFFVGLLIMPFSLANELMGYWIFGKVWCSIHSALDVLLCTSSIMNICLISLDRYWSITQAIEYLKKRTPARAMIMITMVWVLSALISIPPLMGWRDDSPQDENYPTCELSKKIGYVLYSAMGSFYIPSCIMVFVYIRIYFAARDRARRQIRKSPRPKPQSSSVVIDPEESRHGGGHGSSHTELPLSPLKTSESSSSPKMPLSPTLQVPNDSNMFTNSSSSVAAEQERHLVESQTSPTEAVPVVAAAAATTTTPATDEGPSEPTTPGPNPEITVENCSPEVSVEDSLGGRSDEGAKKGSNEPNSSASSCNAVVGSPGNDDEFSLSPTTPPAVSDIKVSSGDDEDESESETGLPEVNNQLSNKNRKVVGEEELRPSLASRTGGGGGEPEGNHEPFNASVVTVRDMSKHPNIEKLRTDLGSSGAPTSIMVTTATVSSTNVPHHNRHHQPPPPLTLTTCMTATPSSGPSKSTKKRPKLHFLKVDTPTIWRTSSSLSLNGDVHILGTMSRSGSRTQLEADPVSDMEPSSSDSGAVSRCAVVKPLKLRLCQPFFGKKHASATSSNKARRDVVDTGKLNSPKEIRDPEREKRRIARKKEKRATLILGLIMGSFILCWLPFFFLYIFSPLCECEIAPWGFAVAFWLGYMNSALNPVIYTIFNKDFRRAFRRILFK